MISRPGTPTTSRRGPGRAFEVIVGGSRRFIAAAAATLAVAVAVTACTPAVDAPASPEAPQPPAGVSPPPSDSAIPPATPPDVPGHGVAPSRLTLPKIGIDATLIDLGIQADGSLEVPTDFDEIGWFTGGGMPGGRGPTVIAAHVDSPSGPAAFVRLGELVPGDRFTVASEDGANFEYEVYGAAEYAKDEFPTVDVFGATVDDEVRLITCTGIFDTSIGHYDNNLVVSARRVLP